MVSTSIFWQHTQRLVLSLEPITDVQVSLRTVPLESDALMFADQDIPDS